MRKYSGILGDVEVILSVGRFFQERCPHLSKVDFAPRVTFVDRPIKWSLTSKDIAQSTETWYDRTSFSLIEIQ